MIKINRPILNKKAITKDLLNRCLTEHKDKKKGITYLTVEETGAMFEDHFVQIGKAYKIVRGWIHFMKKGESYNPHDHANLTALYYLQVDEDSGKLYFTSPERKHYVPVNDDFYIFEAHLLHGITKHNSDLIRLAIAMELEELW